LFVLTVLSDNDNAGRLWSGFSEDLSDGYRRFEPEETAIHKKIDDSSQAIVTSSPGLGDVVVRIQTPASVAGNESEFTPRDTESIHRRNAELQNLLARVLGQNEELRSETRKQSELIAQYEEEYGEAHGEIEAHKERVRILEKQVKGLQSELSRNISSPMSSPRQNQRIAELRAKVDSLEFAAKEQADSHRRENEEYEHRIRHLTAALDQQVGSTINEPLQKRIVELEEQLEKERKAHSEDMTKTEDKYKQILAENDGMINHLQAELDEYAGQLSMDPGDRTSRIFDGDDNGDWSDERSREVSQMFENSFDQIITQIGGDPDRDDFDEKACMEAEKSLRYLASTAGFDNLNKADLAAFGIKYLRDDNAHYKGLHAQSEEKVKQLIAANASLTTEMEKLKERVKGLETQNGVLLNSISDSETTISRLQGELKEHQIRITEANRALKDALQAKEKSESKIKASEAELATLQQAYARDQKELERATAKLAQAEAKAKEQAQHLVDLRTQLQETTGRDSTLQAEVDAYKQRTSELLRTVETADKTYKDRIMALEEQLDDLRSAKETLIKERDAAREADKRTAELSAIIFKLEEKIAASDEAMVKLKAEKEALEIATYNAETESKQARSRFNVLLHESAEKENIWNTVKSQLQTEIEQKTRELHHAVEPYAKALEVIASEIDEIAPEREQTEEERQSLKDELVSTGVAAPEIVIDVLVGIRTLDEILDASEAQLKSLDEKNQRFKNAIKKWNAEHSREKSKIEALRKENKDLALRLKAEKKQSDEKIGQLILALRS
jgi:chromosome segregation ATPase